MSIVKDLGPEADGLIQKLISTGDFDSDVEVIRRALQLLKKQHLETLYLQNAVDDGLASPLAAEFTCDDLIQKAKSELGQQQRDD